MNSNLSKKFGFLFSSGLGSYIFAVMEEIINLERLFQEIYKTCSVSFILRSRRKIKLFQFQPLSHIVQTCILPFLSYREQSTFFCVFSRINNIQVCLSKRQTVAFFN